MHILKKMFLKLRRKLFLNAVQGMLLDSEQRLQQELIKKQTEWQTFAAKKLIPSFLAACRTNRETFLPFKNYCKGKKLVICGAGPTLADFNPIDNAVYIALNRAVLFDKVDFDFLFVQDWLGIRHISKEIVDYKGNNCVKLFAYQNTLYDNSFLHNTPESFVNTARGKRFYTDIFTGNGGPEDNYRSEFVVDIDNKPIGNFLNVGLSAVQFALFMNPKKIYLVGIDCKGGHYTYQNMAEGEARKDCQNSSEVLISQLKSLCHLWEKLRQFASVFYPDTEIISVNPVGLKGIFKDWYQSDGDEPDSRQNV